MDAGAAGIARALNGRRCGAGFVCRCPAHDDRRPSLRISETKFGKVLIKCWSGCEQDAVIDALRRRGLWGGKPTQASHASERSDAAAGLDQTHDPTKSWRNALPFIRGSVVDRYLKSRRGIELTDDEARSLRYSPSLWHWPTKTKWPAMLACVALASGAPITSHQTFLEPDGSDKAPLGDKARLFAAGGKTVGGGVWFGAAETAQELIVGEGIESTLSAMRIFGSAAGCAALSANGIRTLILPADARRVRIFADNDALGQGLALARAAARRWLAEGRTVAVSISPKVGEDANDVWLRRSR